MILMNKSSLFCSIHVYRFLLGIWIFFIPAAFVTPTSVVAKKEIIVYQNQDLDSRTSIYVSTVGNRVQQNQPQSSTYIYMPTIDDSASGMSSIQISIIILLGLCILLMILYAASFVSKLQKTEHEPSLVQIEVRDNYSF